MERNSNISESGADFEFWEFLKKILTYKKLILKILVVFFIVGLVVAVLTPRKYTASIVISPQFSSEKASGGLAAAASMFGISLGGTSNADPITPKMYPLLMSNAELLKDLIYTPFKFDNQDTLVTFKDYFVNEKYNQVNWFGYVRKYTIGLPRIILNSLSERKHSSNVEISDCNIVFFTEEESKAVALLKSMIDVSVNEKDGYVTISGSASQPLFVSQLVKRVTDLIQSYVTKSKVERAKTNFDFVKERFDEAKKDYKRVQMEYAKFIDANVDLTSAVAKTKRAALEREYQFSSNLYNEVSNLLLHAEIKVKEDTPCFSIVKPILVPNSPSKPNRFMILFSFLVLGVVVSVGVVVLIDMKEKIRIVNTLS